MPSQNEIFFLKRTEQMFQFFIVKVVRVNNVFITSAYRKAFFSGVYKHFDNYILQNYIFSLVSENFFGSFTICSEMLNYPSISVYREPTFRGIYMHFNSYMLLNYKFSLVSASFFCSFTLCADIPKLHQEICKIKDIFIEHRDSERFIDKCIKTFFNKLFIPKRIIQTAEKKTSSYCFTLYGHYFD